MGKVKEWGRKNREIDVQVVSGRMYIHNTMARRYTFNPHKTQNRE